MDLNLLSVLDVLLQEESVVRAADRLGSSPAAVSRKLATLRRITGDPLLVRAGQRLTPTPRAVELRPEVRALMERTASVLAPGDAAPLDGLRRTFTVQAAELLQLGLAGPLVERVRAAAPEARTVFLPEALEGTPALRQGVVDVELGVLSHLDPEIRTESLASVALQAAARADHPLLGGPIDARRFAAAEHVGVSRTGRLRGPIDEALAGLGLRRRVAVVLPGHVAAMALAASTDLVCLAPPARFAPALDALGLRVFPIPVPVPAVEIGMAWHPRQHADAAHRWFRGLVRETVAEWAAAAR